MRDTQGDAPVIIPLLLRIRGAAAMLAVSERTVWMLIRSGDLTPIHPRGVRAIRIAREEVDALVARWQTETAASAPLTDPKRRRYREAGDEV